MSSELEASSQSSVPEGKRASSLTLRDLARSLKVSHSTVSRALGNSPSISLARRSEIQAAAKKLGYRPNAVATRLSFQRHAHKRPLISSEIAWINCWPETKKLRSHKEFDFYWQGARERAEATGYRLEEFICGPQLSLKRLENILIARNIHGILIPPHGLIDLPKEWRSFDWQRFCVVRFGYSIPEPPAHLVTSNHLTCGMLAIDNMRRLGYQRIGFVTTQFQHINFRAGFLVRQTISQAPPKSIFTFSTASAPEKDLSGFDCWLRKCRPEAILSDVPRTREYLEKLGYNVPADIGLAATSILDGKADAGIDQHSMEIGRVAIETLLSLLNHNQYGIPTIPREVLITGSWVQGTTLPPR